MVRGIYAFVTLGKKGLIEQASMCVIDEVQFHVTTRELCLSMPYWLVMTQWHGCFE
jgi:hypothetical protein